MNKKIKEKVLEYWRKGMFQNPKSEFETLRMILKNEFEKYINKKAIMNLWEDYIVYGKEWDYKEWKGDTV